eukprot:CAMPEP_0175096390 /NCGR_PEP_ID=MMETSP0086_2-20121207/4708_1 /TAXON_ID=136419 /ORGANISM="Unknown Unknown, Strain D1" /LENGTH=87 /DNA_ID=CAMNT_0016369791 /DNA_START=26 /DNA_END=289 /DNA_ORIENTATION=-
MVNWQNPNAGKSRQHSARGNSGHDTRNRGTPKSQMKFKMKGVKQPPKKALPTQAEKQQQTVLVMGVVVLVLVGILWAVYTSATQPKL